MKGQRLVFIDVARTIAILLMLEGHFISATLDISLISTDHWVYIGWSKIRTITAPLFLMVSGMIFSHLLSRHPELNIRNNPRIKKGLIRAVKLFLWGVLLHVSLLQVRDYFSGSYGQWLFSFHVLQCIAVGLLVMTCIYVLYKLIGGRLVWYYFVAATLLMALYPFVSGLSDEEFYPLLAHPLIQNAIKGPYSIFPLIPWLSFILYGAAIGAHLSAKPRIILTNKFPLTLIAIGLFLSHLLNHLLFAFDGLDLSDLKVLSVSHLYDRIGIVLMILGGLILILSKIKINQKSLLLRVGQQTLVIYILHCVVLYGALTGIGIDTYLHHLLTPFQAVIGAVLFLAFFTVVAVLAERVQGWYRGMFG